MNDIENKIQTVMNEIEDYGQKFKNTIRELFSKGIAYDQVRWERDIAISQLNDLGIEFGENVEDYNVTMKKKNNIKTLVVNLFGVPGAGKSTGAAQIFASLKKKGVNAELVTEFAKDKVWEDNQEVFKNHAYIFGKQSFKISRCNEKVDVIITDSPLPLSIFYNSDPLLTEDFNNTVMNVFNGYKNMNYLLIRTKPYNPTGRFQTEEESDLLKEPLVELLNTYNIPYKETTGDDTGYDMIVNEVLKNLNK